ncbi:MAG: preprotein translocase subunit SecG [Proteobacteria bacterium]|nr:preprotein translocase subunit SecG [Pseudomonadota bacterium]
MFTAVVVIHIVVSVVLVGSVLLHSGKGASLGSSFGGSTSSQALFGSAGPASLFTKVTATCAVIFMITSLYITYVSAHKDEASIMQNITPAPAIVEDPAFKDKEKKDSAAAPGETKEAETHPGFKDTTKKAAPKK